MTTKSELQKQIDALQAQLDGMEYWYLGFDHSYIICCKAEDFLVSKSTVDETDQPHGLGKYKSKEYAEMARAFIMGALLELKHDEDRPIREIDDDNWFVQIGKKLIAELEQGGCDGSRD